MKQENFMEAHILKEYMDKRNKLNLRIQKAIADAISGDLKDFPEEMIHELLEEIMAASDSIAATVLEPMLECYDDEDE